MKEVFVLHYKGPNAVEVFESHDDAVDAGLEYVAELGRYNGWSEDEISDKVSAFDRYRVCEVVELYCCGVKEARQ